MNEFACLTMVAMEIGNRLLFSYHSNGCYNEKKLHKNLNLKDLNYDWKIWADWISARWDKKSQPQKYAF